MWSSGMGASFRSNGAVFVREKRDAAINYRVGHLILLDVGGVPFVRLQWFRHAKERTHDGRIEPTSSSSLHGPGLLTKWATQASLSTPERGSPDEMPYVSSYLVRPAALLPAPASPVRAPLSLPPYQAGVKHHPCRHRRSCKHTCSRRAAHHLALLASCCCICLVHDCIAALCSAVDSPPGLVTAKPIFRCSVSKSLIRLFIWDHFFLSDAAGSLAMSCDRRRLKTVSRCPFSLSLSVSLPPSHLLRLLLL